jgi:pimeloyl-ACP methyl ester carboxylesterase
MASIADLVVERWFTPAFRESGPADVEAARQALLITPPDGYIACCAALRDMDQRDQLATIRAPALVIAGRHDPATTPADCRLIADAIPRARLVELSAAHLSNIEAAEAFNAAVLGFLIG